MTGPDLLWMIATLAVLIYCIAQAVRDFRARKFVWAAAATIAALIIATVPHSVHAISVTLPVND